MPFASVYMFAAVVDVHLLEPAEVDRIGRARPACAERLRIFRRQPQDRPSAGRVPGDDVRGGLAISLNCCSHCRDQLSHALARPYGPLFVRIGEERVAVTALRIEEDPERVGATVFRADPRARCRCGALEVRHR